nr:hypothetical protein Iba_chr11cCG4830 [Ipomoea batatas]
MIDIVLLGRKVSDRDPEVEGNNGREIARQTEDGDSCDEESCFVLLGDGGGSECLFGSDKLGESLKSFGHKHQLVRMTAHKVSDKTVENLHKVGLEIQKAPCGDHLSNYAGAVVALKEMNAYVSMEIL